MYAYTVLPSGVVSWRVIESTGDALPLETLSDTCPLPSLVEVTLEACARVDAAADAAYVAIGGPSPGRLAEYKQAKADADAFKALAYLGTVPDTIACWAEAKEWTAQQACDDILATAARWEVVLSAIRRQRLIGKAAVRAATDAASAHAATDSVIATIQSIAAQAA